MKPLRIVYVLAYVGLLATAFLVFNDLPPAESGLADWFFDIRAQSAAEGTLKRNGWEMTYVDSETKTPYTVRITSLEIGDRRGWYGKVEFELVDMNTGERYRRCTGARWVSRRWTWAAGP
ncbi:MAG: hypothetical protein JSU73_07590 [candidate division WOR-3 bacterium]|nr:MAG: hypothetical protein JSU73_07590 [candidate division WOR-3 bacterium]